MMVIPRDNQPQLHRPGPDQITTVLRHLPRVDLRALCERRFRNGFACPRCGSKHLHGHGKYRGRRRFRCVECGRTFNELTGTPLHGTRYPEKWPAYVCCLYWGLSLRLTAQLLGISLPTAFAWRHKLVSALRQRAIQPVLEGIVEFDELYVLESQKGSRQLNRPARRRGTGDSMNRWRPHRNRACVIAVVDRADGCMAGVSGFGPPTVLDLERFLEPSRFRGNAMCVDNRQAYWSFSIRHRVPRIVLSTPKARRGRYHMVNVNQFLTHFEQWMTRFNGVATRYLANYVAWFVAYREAFAWLADAIGVSQQWLARSFDLPQFGS